MTFLQCYPRWYVQRTSVATLTSLVSSPLFLLSTPPSSPLKNVDGVFLTMSAVRRKMTTFDGMIRTLNVLLSLQLAEKLRRHRFFFGVSYRSIKWQSRSLVVTKRYSYSTTTKKVNGLVSYYDECWPLGKDDDAYYYYYLLQVEQSLLMTLTRSYYMDCSIAWHSYVVVVRSYYLLLIKAEHSREQRTHRN